LHHTNPIILKVIIPSNEIPRTEEVITAIHKHFFNRRQKSSKELKHMLNLGWRSLLIAFLFLTVMYVVTQTVNNVLPENGFIITIRESLIILGWVAFWRPAELLLYEWRPFKRNVNLFDRLEHSNVQVVAEEI
jgi:hypothetical protein